MVTLKKKLVLNQDTLLRLEIGKPTDTNPAPVGTRLIGCTYTK
jgi:hypothetical protein